MKTMKTLKKQKVLRKLFNARVHLGHRKCFWHPRVASYIYGVREGVHILDLKQTIQKCKYLFHFLLSLLSSGGKILVIGNIHENALFVRALSTFTNRYTNRIAFLNHKWKGGSLTNREMIDATSPHLKNLEGFPVHFGTPDLILLLNPIDYCLQEARLLRIPVVGIVDTPTNPDLLEYAIPGNDDSLPSHFFYCQAFHYIFQKYFSKKKTWV